MRGRQKDLLFCVRGHVREGSTNSSGKCRICDRERARNKREAIKNGTFVPRPKREENFCAYGHPITEGSVNSGGRCKECVKEYQKRWGEQNKEQIKIRKQNRPKEQKQRDNERSRQWAKDNREEKKRKDAEYRNTHKEEKKIRHDERMKTDVQYKLACSLRWRMNRAIRLQSKSGSAVSDLGCTIPELKAHLESQFREGMTWNNWGSGSGKWHIDHIRPLVSFDLEDREQFLVACNFLNLQPLWSEENISKGSKTVDYRPVPVV